MWESGRVQIKVSYHFQKTLNILKKMAAPMLACLAVGTAVRFLLFRTSVPDWLAEKNEISTPLTSWKRGVFYFEL